MENHGKQHFSCDSKTTEYRKLLCKLNKNFIVYLSMWYGIGIYHADLCTFRYCIPQKVLPKIPENSENYNCGKLLNATFLENRELATLVYSLFAQFSYLRGEPGSRVQICTHCGAYAVRCCLNGALISLNTLHASGTGELKQRINYPNRGFTCN